MTTLFGIDVGTSATKGVAIDPTARSWPKPRPTTRSPPRAPAGPAHPGRGLVARHRHALERLIELTGNRALTGFTAPKLLWLRAHEPDV